ncbi:MAG TPA: PilZ domain-containing protein [Arenimonas sp.]|nr:PilZ domain-containing protein [Arenimonas sp.]
MSEPHASQEASTRAEQQLCGDALCTFEELPVRWTPQTLSAIASERLAEHAEGLLRTMALVEETFSDDPEERGNTDLPMHRVEAKLQLLLEMVGTLLARQSDLPTTRTIRWSRLGLSLDADQAAETDATGVVELQLLPWLPQLLSLPCRVLACIAEGERHRVWLAFDPLSPALEAALERHLFRRHRRAISASRRQR